MAALAAKAMGAAPVKEKRALPETRRQHAKKAKSIIVGSSSRSGSSRQAEKSRSVNLECIAVVDDRNTREEEEAALERTDGAMEKSFGRLALQASSTTDGIGEGGSAETSVEIYEASQSTFCIRRYTEIVRQDRGDLKRSWPLAEEYLRGHISSQGRVQLSLWPSIGAEDQSSALTQAHRSSFYTLPDAPLPHLFKLEIAFAESGVSEDKPEQLSAGTELLVLEKRILGGSHMTCNSSDLLVERRTSEVRGSTMTKTSKSERRKISSSAADSIVDCEPRERQKKKKKKKKKQQEDRCLQESEAAKHVEQVATAERTSSFPRGDSKEFLHVVERGAKQPRSADDTTTTIHAKDSPRSEPEGETVKGKRFSDAGHFQARRTVDKASKPQSSSSHENGADAGDKVGKGKTATLSSVEVVEARLSSMGINNTTHFGDVETNAKRVGGGGDREFTAIEKEVAIVPKRRSEDDRIVEERSSKSDASRSPSSTTKRQSNKACPVCRSFSSVSQTTMNVHIDSCLVEHHHRQEADAASDPIESETDPEPPAPPRSKPLIMKSTKPKQKKRSIADIVASSVTRTLEESPPGKEGVRSSHCNKMMDLQQQAHDSKNLNWVSGNKKKRQPRNVPSRNPKEENESKRRRLSRAESTVDVVKPAAKQGKRRLPEKEREGTTTKAKQLRVAGPSTSVPKFSKVQDGVEAEPRRSRKHKAGLATSDLPGPGKGHGNHSNKGNNQKDASGSQSKETRTTAEEDLPMELDETLPQSLDSTAPRKSLTSAQENSAPSAATLRAGKAYLNSGTTGRLVYPVPSTDRAPKAPWYPPAAMLRSGTITHVTVTEAAVCTPSRELIREMTNDLTLTAEKTDASRTVPATNESTSTRNTSRANSIKGQKGSRRTGKGGLLTDEGKAGTSDHSHKVAAQAGVLSMAECRMAKEVDRDLDQIGTAVEGKIRMIQHSSDFRGGSETVPAESPHQLPSTEAKTDFVSEKAAANEVVGKSEGTMRRKKRPTADKSRITEERRGSVVAEEESVTAISSEVDVTKLDPPSSILQKGCSSGDTQIVSVGARKTSTSVTRMRKNGGSKAKSRKLAEKTNGTGKKVLVGNAGQLEETNQPNADVSEEASMEKNPLVEDKLKQEHQRKEQDRLPMGTVLQPTLECSSGKIQPDLDDRVDADISNVAYPSMERGESQEGQSSSAHHPLADPTRNLQLQGSKGTPNSTAHLRFCRDTELGVHSSHTKEVVVSQTERVAVNTPVEMVEVVQGQSARTWSLVPQRPFGRKKLPIKCAARGVSSANAVVSAANQASNMSSKNNSTSQGTECKDTPATDGGAEKGDSAGHVRAANNMNLPATAPKISVGRSRAARQLAKSVPGGKRGSLHGEVLPSEGQTSVDPNAEEKSDNVGSTHMAPSQQALLSPSSRSATNPVHLPSTATPPERVPTSNNHDPEPMADDGVELRSEVVAEVGVPVSVVRGRGAHVHLVADESRCAETLFGSFQSNPELVIHARTFKEATTDELRDIPSSAVVANATESGTSVGEKPSDELDGSASQLAVSRQVESDFSAGRSPDRSGLGRTSRDSSVCEQNDKDSRESVRSCNPKLFLSTIFNPTVVESQRSCESPVSPGKVVEAIGQVKPDNPGRSQSLVAGHRILKGASTSAGVSSQVAQGLQNRYNPVTGSTRRVNTTATTDAVNFQVANIRPVMTTTSFTSLLQSTVLPSQSSTALSLAMRGTRPLQEACADRTELSREGVGVSTRAVTDPTRRSVDGITWGGSEKHAPSSCNDVLSSHIPAGTAFFRPPPEMGGPNKSSEARDKEVSSLPGWMRAAISDPKGSDRGPIMTTEAEYNLTGSPEGGEMSGPVRVRLWGRDVVVPPNEKSTKGNPTAQQGQRSEAQLATVTASEMVASCPTSMACSNGLTVDSQAGLKVNIRPDTPRVGAGVSEGSSLQINAPVISSSNCEVGVIGSTERVPAFGKSKAHPAENYLSGVQHNYNNQRSSCTENSREEIRSSRSSKGHTSAAQSTSPPEVIIIDDSAESPAKSGDSFSGEGLTMAFLLDCGALRYLPSGRNGRSGSQLMEVDPSKIPQRLINQNFNILAELKKIGLVPAPKAVLPASYRHSHSLSVEVPHSSPSSSSRAGTDVLPPWLLAEKKRKEAQIAENLIVLDDDDEPPTGTIILGERQPLSAGASPGSTSNHSEQPESTGQVSSSSLTKPVRETKVMEHCAGAVRNSYSGATTIIHTAQAGVPSRRGTGSSPDGNEPPVTQKNTSRTNDNVAGDLLRPAAGKRHVNTDMASDSVSRDISAASKGQHGGVQTASGRSPTLSRRQREDSRTDKETQQVQVFDLQNEEKTVKTGAAANKPGLPAPAAAGQGGSLLKKGSSQGISILAPTWMSGNNGWPKRGAAAQACKQAVERLKAQILSSPLRDGTSQGSSGRLLDFGSHMIGQAQEKSTSFAGNLPSASEYLSVSSQATQGVSRFIVLPSRGGGDYQKVCAPKETPHDGRGVGQSPTPGTFPSAAVAAEGDVSTLSKSPSASSAALHSMGLVQGGAQGSEAHQGRGRNPVSETSAASGPSAIDGKMSNLVAHGTQARESLASEQSSPSFPHLGRSSPSPTLRSRSSVGAKVVNKAGTAGFARGANQSEQGYLLPAQGTHFSRLPPSRLSLPLEEASVTTSSAKALLGQVSSDSLIRDVSSLQATGRMSSPHTRIQQSRAINIATVSGEERTIADPVRSSDVSSATIITSSSSVQSRPHPGFPSSCSPSTPGSDQRRQQKSGAFGAVNRIDIIPVVGRRNLPGTGTSRSPTSDLPLSSVFGRLSQTSNSSPSSSQAGRTVIDLRDGGMWTSVGQTDASDQASETGLSDRLPGRGIISDYRFAPQIAGVMMRHTQRSRATNPTASASGGFFADVVRATKQQESDSSPRSRDSDCVAVSAHEEYSQSTSTRDEKMKEAKWASAKFSTAETAEKHGRNTRAR